MHTLEVDPSNADQAHAWDGDEGRFWADNAAVFDAAVAGYHHRFLEAAAIRADDSVLDIGCGSGQTTRDAARLAHRGQSLGIDLSHRMLDVARRLTEREGLLNARFEQADAQVRRFPAAEFDVVISRTGCMFFGDPTAAFSNLAQALRPGGRLALLTWQSLTANEWIRALVTAVTEHPPPDPAPEAPGPFSMADPDRVLKLLSGCGLVDIRLSPQQEPMSVGRDAEEAEGFVLGLLGWMMAGLDEVGRSQALARLRASLSAHVTADGVRYDSAAWVITARRR